MITKVYLLNVPLENDYKHTIYFENKDTQEEYFKSKIVKSYECSYQRKDSIIRVPGHYDELGGVNYVMYKNMNKWYYAFITDMKYVHDDRTDITIETDCIQTWLFDYIVKPSFVEREHVSDDTRGAHTIPEGLETGEYKVKGMDRNSETTELCIIMAYSDYASINADVNGNVYGGVYSGMAYSAFPLTDDGIKSLNNMIHTYNKDGKGDAIQSIFMAPKYLVTDASEFGAMTLGKSYTPKKTYQSILKDTTVDGYEPKNNKVLCYPYTYLLVSNNNGSNAIYKQELFTDDSGKCTFEIDGVISPGCSIRLVPTYYNGLSTNHEEGLNLGKYAICCWNNDSYTNWMTQNSVNNAVGLGAGVASIIGGAVLAGTGAGLMVGGGMIAGGVGAIAGSIGQISAHSKVPDQSHGNINCGDVITGSKNNCFLFYSMTIKKEYAKVIDDYFSVFGYKINRVKVPNKCHRSRWWYTKTIDVNIDGGIPMKDINTIKRAYNQGITFWRNASEVQRYDLSNSIAITDGAVTDGL